MKSLCLGLVLEKKVLFTSLVHYKPTDTKHDVFSQLIIQSKHTNSTVWSREIRGA